MNLYKYHSKPETLDHYDVAFDKVPKLIWGKYRDQPAELRKREKVLAKDTKTAFLYAHHVRHGPFPAGETVIAQDPEAAVSYAEYVLRGPFPAGEAAIAKDPEIAYH